MHITYFHRLPQDFHFSIEKLFNTIRESLPHGLTWTIQVCPYNSTGLINRIKNIKFANKNKGILNHITGDVHYIALGLPKNRTINTYHDFTFLKTNNFLKRAFLMFFWVQLPVKRSAIITVISNTTKEELIKLTNCAEKKIRVIPNIISSAFNYSPRIFNSNVPEILQIGTTPNKNIERLCEALSDVRCRLHIVGKLSKGQLKSLDYYKIDYVNYVQIPEQELIQLYKTTDMLTFCSINEGFGMPILEAQATGRPVVTSNLSSMPEVAGDAACLVNPFDVESIRSGILKIANDSIYREDLIKKGLENVKRFNAKEVASMYNAIYSEIEIAMSNQHK